MDRLPPVVSNRRWPVARLELWLKGKMKRAHALVRVGARELQRCCPSRVARHAARAFGLRARSYGSLSARLATAEAATQAETEARQTEAQQYRIRLAAQLEDLEDLRTREDQLAAQLEALVNELRERDAHLRGRTACLLRNNSRLRPLRRQCSRIAPVAKTEAVAGGIAATRAEVGEVIRSQGPKSKV